MERGSVVGRWSYGSLGSELPDKESARVGKRYLRYHLKFHPQPPVAAAEQNIERANREHFSTGMVGSSQEQHQMFAANQQMMARKIGRDELSIGSAAMPSLTLGGLPDPLFQEAKPSQKKAIMLQQPAAAAGTKAIFEPVAYSGI
jgi:hypothetical protein